MDLRGGEAVFRDLTGRFMAGGDSRVTAAERVLLAYGREDASLPAMSAVQRVWCVGQIPHAVKEAMPHPIPDKSLALAVLHAWMDESRATQHAGGCHA